MFLDCAKTHRNTHTHTDSHKDSDEYSIVAFCKNTTIIKWPYPNSKFNNFGQRHDIDFWFSPI